MYQPSPEALAYVYGGEDLANDYVKPCPTCKGFKKCDEDLTGTPDQYRSATYEKFKWDVYGQNIDGIKKITDSFLNDFKKWSDKGRGLYISSTTAGSGKTFLACCLCKSIMMMNNLRYKFITVPDYIGKVSEGYTLAKQGIPDSPADIYKEVDILVLDDIGTQLDKPWQNQELFKLINQRFNKGLITVYTSNHRIDQLSIDDRIKSRIMGTSISLPMPEVAVRQNMAVSGQNDFLRGLFNGEE